MTFKDELARQHLEIPYSLEIQPLSAPLILYGRKISNRIGILPLEGYDSAPDGSPTEHVYRRYLRFVSGGAGLIWFEACAVSSDGKSNPGQMMLQDQNLPAFRELLSAMDRQAQRCHREPCFKIIQLTHSGRVSKTNDWEPIPLSPCKQNDQDSAEIAADERIAQMVEEHIHAAELAAEAGFDAVDIKVCHGYFLCELLSAYHREGKYGGSFENRTRAIFEIIDGIRSRVGNRIGISVRLNAYDSRPYPYGFCVLEKDGKLQPDLTEAIRLCKLLAERGVQLINISASSPEERLFAPEPSEAGYRRYGASCDYLMATRILKEQVPEVTFMCTGLSSFGDQGGYVAAGGIQDGWFDLAGFGRQALAYPAFAGDLLTTGKMNPKKCCVNCNKCFDLMDPGHSRTGCIVRDSEIFLPLYRQFVLKK